MTDTHTHILPGIDDGAADISESLRILTKCKKDGVKTVVLTPHFYPTRESVDSFLERRARAFDTLQAAVTPDLPRLVLGAEVAWCAGLENMKQIRQLTMGSTDYLLLEMPYMEWTRDHLESVWNLASDGRVIPVLAHVERFLHLQHGRQYRDLAQMQIPMQLSAEAFSRTFSRMKALRMMKQGQWMIGSDCHNLTNRPPCMAEAARCLQARAPEQMYALNWEFI